MAKYNSKKSIHTHVPTKVGFTIIALVALVFGLTVATQYNTNNQTQTVQSEAAGTKIVTTTKQCISYNTANPPKCLLYQQTTTTVNTSSPCLSYNTSNKCTYYKDTTPMVTIFVPTGTTKQTTSPAVISKAGPGILVCHKGQEVAVGGAAYNESKSELAHICSLNQNTVFVGSSKYPCSNAPAAYKSLCNAK